MKTEIEADEVRIRRFTEDDGETAKHFTITGETESGALVRIRADPTDIEPELDRYVEERLRGVVEGLDEWFHDQLKEDVNEQLSDLSDTFEEGLGRIKDELNLKRPRSTPEEDSDEGTAEAEDSADVEDSAEVTSKKPTL